VVIAAVPESVRKERGWETGQVNEDPADDGTVESNGTDPRYAEAIDQRGSSNDASYECRSGGRRPARAMWRQIK
jgi:hypothetical protein